MKKGMIKLLLLIILLIGGFIYYYIALPAINIHSPGLWLFLISIIVILICIYSIVKFKDYNPIILKSGVIFLSLIIAVFLIGSLLSSQIINSKKYQSLISISERNFTDDIKEISFDEIPILDKESAEKLGSRKMGSLSDMVSQFEVSDLYSQINYNQLPTRVSPLEYGNIFKWISNHKSGIPAYIKIDMATQNAECIKLDEGIKYSFSEPFGRNVNRYLRFNYPTYIFDTINFEINDEGIPYWICPVKNYTIGLFGGITIDKVILLNAITGELKEYNINDVPQWVDKVYSAELLISYYNYYGKLKHGYINSILGQKDCLQTTAGYNYIALEDDVWVYTGITSVGSDSSNVGFVLMNQRTSETRYYSITGAEEFSAMASAEGQVQNLGYKSTFPLLLNIANEPTYFIALKDNAGLVKSYAMVNIQKYQIVAIGESIGECEKKYISLLNDNGINKQQSNEIKQIKSKISKIQEITIDGNTHYFITLSDSKFLYNILVSENISILNYNINDEITLNYQTGDEYNTVISIE